VQQDLDQDSGDDLSDSSLSSGDEDTTSAPSGVRPIPSAGTAGGAGRGRGRGRPTRPISPVVGKEKSRDSSKSSALSSSLSSKSNSPERPLPTLPRGLSSPTSSPTLPRGPALELERGCGEQAVEIKLSTQVQQLKVEELSEVKDVGQTKGGDHDQVVGELPIEDLRLKTLEEQFPLAKARGPPCSQLL